MKVWKDHFLFYMILCFALGSIGYAVFYLVMPKHQVFGSLFRMFLYHSEHPLQYIFLISLVFGAVASTWAITLGHWAGMKRALSIVAVIILSIVISSPFGGILWTIHDMQAGFFPHAVIMMRYLLEGAWGGIELGWLIIALSVPYNICGTVVGYMVVTIGQRRMANKVANKPLLLRTAPITAAGPHR